MRKISEILQEGEEFNDFVINCGFNFSTFFKRALNYDYARHHREIFEMINRYKRNCIEAPRQHGKTTLVSSFFIWKMFFGNKLNFLIVSNSLDQSKKIIEMMQDTILENEMLQSLAPDDRTMSWNKTTITTTNKCKVTAMANNDNIRGGTYDYVLCDEAGQYEDESVFYGVIMPTVIAKDGTIIMIGTPQTKVDLLHEVCNESDFVSKFHRAIQDEEALWPDKYSLARLMEIKKGMPAIEWEREFMCNPIGDETSLFPYDMLSKSFDIKSRFISYGDPDKRYFLSADFAMSPRAGADYSVFTVVEQNITNKLRIVRIERTKGESFQEQFDRFKRLYNNFRIVKAMVDEGSFGKAFFDKFKEYGFSVEAYNFNGERRMDLLTKLRNMFENERVIIPRDKSCAETMKQTDILIDELMSMGITFTEKQQKIKWESMGRHDDTVMSLGMAILCVEGNLSKPTITFI